MSFTRLSRAMMDMPSPEQFGAVTSQSLSGADSVADAYPAFMAMFDKMTAINYTGAISLGSGYYALDTPLVCDKITVFEGIGARESHLHARHKAGAAVQFKNGYSGLKNCGVTAGATRRAGTKTLGDYGVLFAADDLPDDDSLGAVNRLHHMVVEEVYIYGHRDDAIHCIGPAFNGRMTQCTINSIGGHGIYFDRGEKSGRTNLVMTLIGGLTNITGCRFSVDGHTICIGSPNGTYTGSDYSTPGLRVIVENCEGSGGADAAIQYVNAGMFIRGANHSLRNNGFNHPNAAMFLAGRNIRVENHRSLGDADHIAIIGSYDELSTQGIIIDGVNVIGPDDALNPAVIATLPSGEAIEPQDIFLNNILPSNVTTVAGTDATMGSGGALRVPGIRINGQTPVAVKSADQTINNTITKVNDADLRIWLKANEKIYFDVVLAVDGDATADFRADVATPAGGTATYSSPTSIKLSDSITAIGQGAQTTGDVIFGASPGTIYTHKLEGYAVNGSTAGWMIVRWAQGTATVADTTLKAGLSRMIVRRV